MNLHRYTINERRGRRSFVHVYKGKDSETASGPNLLDASVEAYVLSGAEHTGVSLDLASTGIKVFVGLSHVACIWLSLKSPSVPPLFL